MKKYFIISISIVLLGLSSCKKENNSLNQNLKINIMRAKVYTYNFEEADGVISVEPKNANLSLLEVNSESNQYCYQYQSDSSFTGIDTVEVEVFNRRISGKKKDSRKVKFFFNVKGS